MFRIKVIHGSGFMLSGDRMRQVQELFRATFPAYADYAEKIPSLLRNPHKHGYHAALFVAEGARARVNAFALLLYFEETKAAFLDFVGARADIQSRGVGGALYEAVREYCMQLGARGLYLDAQPDDPELTPEPAQLEESRRRMRFYERYGVRVIDGTLYHLPIGNPPTPGHLLFDGLGAVAALSRGEARRTVELILRRRFGHITSPAYIRRVVNSFRDDPVRFRPMRYRRGGSVKPDMQPPRLAERYALVFCPKHELHHVRERGYFERPVRAEAIRESLASLGIFTITRSRYFSQRFLAAVHEPDFRHFLRNVCGVLKARRPVYPEAFPIRRPEHRPKHLPEQAGYYCLDADTPLYKNAYAAAIDAVNAALTGADEILAGRRMAYAVCRPPGHHAGRRFFGGFCYFNNAAIAVQYLSAQSRTAILDLDFHHGNGTQDIFYERDDVMFVSVHGHPDHAYPLFSGFANETGAGAGLGWNRNFPLPPNTDDEQYLPVFYKALACALRKKPDALVVSLGFDAMRGDPTGSFTLRAAALNRMGAAIAETGLPVLVVQEGGYNIRNLRHGSRAFFTGFARADQSV